MSHSQKARVFGVLFVLAASVFFFGESVSAQSSDRPDRLSATSTPQSGSTIVCIVYSNLNGVGVPIPVLDAGSCSDQGGHVAACNDGIDNDGDGRIDAADPGCHSDGNAANGATYVSSLDDESATIANPSMPQCMNGIDDEGDGLVDRADPGCHTDGDASNIGSYVSGDSSEGDPLPPENTLALCSDGLDNDADGTIDLADSGCVAFKPTLVASVTITNSHGGSATTSDTQIFLDAMSLAPGVATTTTVGAHQLTATTTATSTAYTVAFGGDCATGGAVSLTIGDSKACSVTFSDVATSTGTGGGGGGTTDTGGGTTTGGGGGGGGNGPVVGSIGGGGGGGPVNYGATATVTPVTSCDTYLTAFIRFGAQNDTDQVRRLQTVLHDDEGAALDINGLYDTPTLIATRAFQQKYVSDILTPWHLDAPTGFVYLTTRKKVNEIYCRNTRQFPLSQAESAVIEQIVATSNTVTQRSTRSTVPTSPAKPKIVTPAAASVPPAASAPSVPEIQQIAAESQAGAAAGSDSDIFGVVRGFFSRLFNRSK